MLGRVAGQSRCRCRHRAAAAATTHHAPLPQPICDGIGVKGGGGWRLVVSMSSVSASGRRRPPAFRVHASLLSVAKSNFVAVEFAATPFMGGGKIKPHDKTFTPHAQRVDPLPHNLCHPRLPTPATRDNQTLLLTGSSLSMIAWILLNWYPIQAMI